MSLLQDLGRRFKESTDSIRGCRSKTDFGEYGMCVLKDSFIAGSVLWRIRLHQGPKLVDTENTTSTWDKRVLTKSEYEEYF